MSDDKKPSNEHRKKLDDDAVERVKATVLGGVGYGRPPQNTRFQKRRSGNPGGGPRRPKSDGLRQISRYSGRFTNRPARRCA